MNIKKVSFEASNENIVGQIIGFIENKKPSILILHGAGEKGKERLQFLAEKLADNNIASFSFDFDGFGESTGKLSESSIKKRVEEALGSLEFVDTSNNFTVIAASMGGHIALELLKFNIPIRNLILLYPALYNKNVYALPFGDRSENNPFSKILREYESWRDNDVLPSLNNFTGNFLVIKGSEDTIIPQGIIDLMDKNSIKAKKKEIIILPGVGHKIPEWFLENSNELERIVRKIIQFIL